jgi:hypothetical protein
MADNTNAVPHEGTYPDWIELHNSGPSPVSLANWSLTDDGNRRKFVFPANTTLAAGGYLVVWCDAAATSGLHSGFSLDIGGETVQLYDANTNLVDAVSFGRQLSNHTLGRLNGSADPWQLNAPSPLAANVAAPLAPQSALAINEWLANPVAGQPDWFELYNPDPTLPVITLQQIEHFFEHYKDLEDGKWVKIGDWGDATAARRAIDAAIERARGA